MHWAFVTTAKTMPIPPRSILLEDVPAGTYSVGEQPIDGFITPDPQDVEIVAGETAQLSLSNAPSLGTVSIQNTDENGEPLGGACFTVGEVSVCDNEEGDANDEAGVIDLTGVAAGSVDVSETSAPAGYAASGEAQTVEVPQGETVTVAFTNTPLVGNLSITKTDQDGTPLGGACFTAGGQTVCDNEDGDANEETGIIDIGNVSVGSVEISESTVPEGYAGGDPQTVEVVEGDRNCDIHQHAAGRQHQHHQDERGRGAAGRGLLHLRWPDCLRQRRGRWQRGSRNHRRERGADWLRGNYRARLPRAMPYPVTPRQLKW